MAIVRSYGKGYRYWRLGMPDQLRAYWGGMRLIGMRWIGMSLPVRSGKGAGVALIAWLGIPLGMGAQQKGPTLGVVLQRLEGNLNHYDADVPSFFCEEHVVSSRTEPHEREDSRATDSVFRLKRTEQADGATGLVESREIKTVNGKAATGEAVPVPTLLTGIFEGGLAVVSVGQTSCMNYKLERSKRAGEIVVRFATFLTPSNTEDCFLQEKSKGRVVVDAASMQVKRLEIETPKHVIDDGSNYAGAEVGRRELTVEYAPVLLGKETFWMPSAIGMRTTSGTGFDVTVWTFQAAYQKYHKLEVTSRILTKPD
jgi:hypothetical protein